MGLSMVFVQSMMPSGVSEDMSCYRFIRKRSPDIMCKVHIWRLKVINMVKIFMLLSLQWSISFLYWKVNKKKQLSRQYAVMFNIMYYTKIQSSIQFMQNSRLCQSWLVRCDAFFFCGCLTSFSVVSYIATR